MLVLKSRTIRLRLVEVSDAEFILGLREDVRYNLFLSKVGASISAQREWIERYKEQEAKGEQFYFIIERLCGAPCGTVRIYDLRNESFSWGSWILNEDKTRYAALESAFLVYSFGFDKLGYERAHFEVMKGNENVVSFHKKMGATVIGEDLENIYFNISKDSVEKSRGRLAAKIS